MIGRRGWRHVIKDGVDHIIVIGEVHGGSLGCGELDLAGLGGEGARKGRSEVGEVEDGGGAFDCEGGDVVCTRRHLWGGEGAEPDPGLFSGFPDLGDPFAPRPHSDPPVNRVFGVPLPLLPPLLLILV